jgi:hypothetical protein
MTTPMLSGYPAEKIVVACDVDAILNLAYPVS